MTVFQIIFYLTAFVAVFSGWMVVTSSNPVRGALFLVLTFVSMAAIWLLLQAEFLALILVLVYVGAVMTLFLFVVMMLSPNRVEVKEGFVRYLPLCAFIVLMIVGLTAIVVGPTRFGLDVMPSPAPSPMDFSNIASLGDVLYTDYAYPFEIAAVILLTALVAAISLTHRVSKKRKFMSVSKQIAVKASDRVRLVDVPSEPKMIPKRGQ